jgi:hypothetical protein
MKSHIAVALLVIALPASAIAGPCQDDLARIDQALASGNVSPEQRGQIEDMRNQAVQLCGAGNEQEGVDVLSEAKAMLEIE